MAIIDLTGTTWIFNETIDLSSTGVTPITENPTHYKYINFTSDGKTFSELVVGSSSGIRWNILGYNGNTYSDSPYQMGMWLYEAYRTIEITGGTDATDSSLIAWLEANATQVQPQQDNKISIGSLPIEKIFIGNTEVEKMTLGNVEIYSKGGSVTPTPTIISFTIVDFSGVDSTTFSYQAEDGMTWQEWVASEYNTGGWTINVDEVVFYTQRYIYKIFGETPDMTIVNQSYFYNRTSVGGGGN